MTSPAAAEAGASSQTLPTQERNFARQGTRSAPSLARASSSRVYSKGCPMFPSSDADIRTAQMLLAYPTSWLSTPRSGWWQRAKRRTSPNIARWIRTTSIWLISMALSPWSSQQVETLSSTRRSPDKEDHAARAHICAPAFSNRFYRQIIEARASPSRSFIMRTPCVERPRTGTSFRSTLTT